MNPLTEASSPVHPVPQGCSVAEAEANLVPNPGVASFASVRRRMLRGSAWVLGGKAATTVLGFVINILLVRLLRRPEVVGGYFTAYTMVIVGSAIGQLGLDRAVVRFVSSAIGMGQAGRARDAVRTVFAYGSLGTVVVGLLVLAGGGWLTRHLLHAPVLAAAIPLVAGWLVATAFQSLLVETFRAFQRFDLSTIFDALLVDVLCGSVFGAMFLVGAHPSLRLVLLVSAGFTATAAVVAGGLLVRPLGKLHGEGRASRGEIFAVAWPVLITNVAIYLLNTGVDLLVLGAFRPQRTVAIYGAAARLMMLVQTPYLILQGVTPPVIAELYAQGRKRELERVLRSVATLAGAPAFVVLAMFVLFGSPVLGLFFGSVYREGASILAILSVGRLVSVWAGSCGITLMMTGHQRQMMYITIFSGVGSITAGILAAPHFGAIGVAVATATAACVQNLLQLRFARRLTGIRTEAELSLKPFLQFFLGKGLDA
jgi:O-antigen/teichoic acid export membrane protein